MREPYQNFREYEQEYDYYDDRPYYDEGPSLGDLFSKLSRETSTLVQQEIALAKAEMSEKASIVGRNVGYMVAGGALAYAGLLAIIAAVIIGLANFIPLWLSALIVGIVVAGIGYALISKGQSGLSADNLTPEQTIESLKEDKEWVQAQMK